ncbi:hypothetical protein FEI15_04635 [Lacticaseibacillus zeae]|uniref:Uncharacterized protein n=1 Tax=Lacticaseibacillus zeae TaxID=57037 RepID=A0A5R8LTI2_LACZE|nr:hypothetical protein FEI15_04635 [Lacticaseibacillus zeae]
MITDKILVCVRKPFRRAEKQAIRFCNICTPNYHIAGPSAKVPKTGIFRFFHRINAHFLKEIFAHH